MTNVVDWILDLFRDPVQAQAFINDPDRSMANAGVQNVSAAQVNAVAATVAPAAIVQGGGTRFTACSRRWPRPTASPSSSRPRRSATTTR
jgi:hypothetical protein